MLRTAVCVVAFALLAQSTKPAPQADAAAQRHANDDLRARIEASPRLPFRGVPLVIRPPSADWQSGAVSGVAVDNHGTIYAIQRAENADPVLVLDHEGNVLRSWGKGNDELSHSIRIDPAGHVWTVDAGSSNVIEYAAQGKKLQTTAVGEHPENGSPFHGATDIAFGPNGGIFITDGYGNARVLEYNYAGTRVGQWGKPGAGPGEFNLPHAIQIDPQGTVYVADRENGRVQEFDLNGKFLAAIDHLGRVYAIKLANGVLWATMGPFDQPPGAPGWLIELDPKSGRLLGHLDIPERGGHALDLMPNGEPIITLGNGLLWFHRQ